MTDPLLTTEEARHYIRMDKYAADQRAYNYPAPGESLTIPLTTLTSDEQFNLDISRGKIVISKTKHQLRYHSPIVLLRLDINGPKHRNPDGQIIEGTHLHIYREDYNDAWAEELPADFADTTNPQTTLRDFMRYCNVVKKPRIQERLDVDDNR